MTASATIGAARDRYGRPRILLVGMFAGFALLLVSFALLYLLSERRDALRDAEVETATLARALQEHAERVFGTVDLQLRNASHRLLQRGDIENQATADVQRVLAEEAAGIGFIRSIYVFDRAGRGHSTSLGADIRHLRATAFEHIARIRENPERDELYIGRPKSGAVTKRVNIPVTRRMADARGGFAGVIGTAIEPAYFEEFFKALESTSGLTVSLLRADGVFLVRYPFQDHPVGSLRAGPVFLEHALRHTQGTLHLESVWDGQQRIMSYRKASQFNLIVSVTQSRDVVLAPWARKATWAAGAVGISIAAMLGLLLVTLAELNNRSKFEAQLKRLSETGVLLSGEPAVVFERVVRMISGLFGVRVACLAEIAGRDLVLKALCADGNVVSDGGSFPLDTTPCATVEETKNIQIHDRVMERFPQASFLRDYNAHTYCGCPALDDNGRVVAVLFLLDDKPREFTEGDQQMLRLICQRVAAETERGKLLAARACVETELHEKQRRLVEAQHIGHMGSWELDLGANRLVWSDEIYAIFEIDPRQFGASYEAFLALVHPDDRWLVNDAYLRSVRERTAYEVEHRLQMPDGRIKYVVERGRTVYAEDGPPLRSSGTVQDITDRKEAEVERARLAAIVQSSDAAIYSRRLDGTILTWNAGAERLYGYTAAEAIGRIHRELLMPEDRKHETARNLPLLERGDAVPSYETVRVTRDGRRIHVLMSLAPIIDANGRVIAVSVITHDVTERKHAEEALRKSERRYRSLVTAASQIVWVTDAEGNVVEDSPEWCKYTGQSLSEYRDGRWMEAVAPEDRARVSTAWQAALGNPQPYEIEFRIRGADNVYRLFICRAAPVLTDDGGVFEWVGILSDITDRRRTQAALEASLREKETLLREIHHRVKNNLQIISSLLYFQSKKVRNPEDVAVFEEGRDRLKSIILVHEKLYRSQSLSRIDFGDYARSLVEQIRASYREIGKRVALKVAAGAVYPPIEVALPCGMLLNELVSNAFKYAYPGERVGEVRVTVAGEEGRLLLAVADDGVGLPAGIDPGKPATFGMQLVANLAEQLGGGLRYKSGAGLTVEVSVPLRKDDEKTEREVA